MSKINLFRGQKHDTKEWVYGDLLHIAGGCIIYHGSQTECTGKPSVGAVLELFSNEISVVIPKTVSQFSGIKDIRGNNIFEGDILKVGENLTCEIFYVENNNEDYGDEIHSSFHAKIKQHNKIIPLDSYLKNNCIIVGNIFDNQDLVSF